MNQDKNVKISGHDWHGRNMMTKDSITKECTDPTQTMTIEIPCPLLRGWNDMLWGMDQRCLEFWLRHWINFWERQIDMMNSPDKNELICYCFGYSINDIETDAIKNNRSLIMEKILAEKRVGDVAKRIWILRLVLKIIIDHEIIILPWMK